MFYGILNYFLDKKIDKLRPVIRKFLTRDLEERKKTRDRILNGNKIELLAHSDRAEMVEENIKTISKRLEMERKYILLLDHFKNDYKRQHMIRKNFHAYLEAIRYLYNTSAISVETGNITVSSNIYHTISEVENSFDQFNLN